MQRATELIEPYTKHPWVRGIYLVGSASRPFRDAISDYDFELAIEDEAYAGLTDSERHVYEIDLGPPRRVLHEFYLRPWSELESLPDSTRDLDHYPFQHARVMFDPEGELAPLLARISDLPDSVREVRLRVHYMEVASGAGRAAKCLERGETLNTRLVVADAVAALVKLLFLVERSWPAMRHWASHELALASVDAEIVADLTAAIDAPDMAAMRRLVEIARERLGAAGYDFFEDMDAFRQWAFLSDEGKSAFATWGAR